MNDTYNIQGSARTPGAVLVRNALLNVAGSGGPMLIGLVSIPILIRSLGPDRFGLLTLAWALIGYFSLFDVGLGRALTHAVAAKLGASDREAVPPLFWGSLSLLAMLGLAAAVLITSTTPWLVGSLLRMPGWLQPEARHSFYLLGLCMPAVILATGFRGLLEAFQRFDLVNAVRIPSGIFTYAGPLAVLPFSNDLPAIVCVLLLGRVATCAVQAVLCFRIMPQLIVIPRLQSEVLRPLFRMGMWMTVSNVISPLMANLDKLFIGVLLSVGAVAYYATPCELIIRLLVIPVAIAAVLFPAFSASLVQNPIETGLLFVNSLKHLFVCLFPVLLITIGFAREGLTVWLGAGFASNSYMVLQWLAAGALLNGLAQIPLTFLQSAGRSDLTAKLHVIELPLYGLSAAVLIHWQGLLGAAMAWTFRVTVDAVCLFTVAERMLGRQDASRLRLLAFVAGGVIILGAGISITSAWAKGLWLVVGGCYAASVALLFRTRPHTDVAAASTAAPQRVT
jgi:O-antigen/teichoic acid export membrane protein